jgi:hypothetical protein
MAVNAGKLGKPKAAAKIVSESYRLLDRIEPATTKAGNS